MTCTAATLPTRLAVGLALVLGILSLGLPRPTCAQSNGEGRYTTVFRGVPLSKALVRIAEKTSANLVYDAKMVEGIRVYCAAEEASLRTVLQCVLQDAPIDFFQTSAGTYVLTRSPRRAPQKGDLSGRVVDAETGQPLPDAHVLLAAANTGIATDPSGRFRLPDLTAGRHRVVATHVGYEATSMTVHVTPGDSTHRQISLSPRAVASDPIVVTQTRRHLPEDGLGSSTLSSDALRAQGDLGTPDALSEASTMLGVHAQRPLADLHVQGGATGEHQVRLDGIAVRNPVTLRRMLGAFSPFGIDQLTVRKAGYGVEHGSTISGVLDARHALSSATPKVGQVQIDPLSLNGEVHRSIALGSDRSAQVRIAGRTSIWDIYQDPTLKRLLRDWNVADPLLLQTYFGEDLESPVTPQAQTSDLGFSDLHVAARVDLGPYRSLTVSGYRGTNRLQTEFVATSAGADASYESGSTMLTQDEYEWQNRAARARLDWMLGSRTSTAVQLEASEQQVQRGYQMTYLPSQLFSDPASPAAGDSLRGALDPTLWPDDHNRIQELSATVSASYSLSSRHHLKGAIDVSRLHSRFRLGSRFFRPVAYEGSRWQVGGYLRDVLSLGAGTTMNVGTRLTYVPARHTVYAEPRLTLRHEGTRSPVGDYALRVGGGVYRQFVNRFDVSSTSPTSILPSLRFWLPTGAAHAPPRAYHATVSARVQPFDRWSATVESYLKQYPHLLALDYVALPSEGTSALAPPEAIGSSQGHAIGVGVAVTRNGPVLESTLRYDWSRSRRRFPSRFDGRLVPPPWNQPHRLALSTSAETGLGIELHVRGTYTSGQSWGLRQTYYDYLSVRDDTYIPGRISFQNPSNHTLSPTTRVDVGGAYSFSIGAAEIEAQVTVTNLFDRQNAFDRGLRISNHQTLQKPRLLPGRRLKASLRIAY